MRSAVLKWMPYSRVLADACRSSKEFLMAIYYIEITIKSFYHEVRSEPEMIARRD